LTGPFLFIMHINKYICFALSLCVFSACAQDRSAWQYGLFIKTDSASNTLPITALGSDSWPNYYSPSTKDAKAWQSVSAEMLIEHTSGWQLGGIVRSEASLAASSGLVDAMALAALRSSPATARNFQLQVQTKSWAGQGLQTKTPWLNIDESKTWSARLQAQWLQLSKLREASGAGVINYSPSNGYVTDLNYVKNYNSSSNSFLSPVDSTGVGRSMSVFLKKDLTNQDFFEIELIDVISQLQWNMVGETGGLNTMVTGDIPHGVEGGQKNILFKQRMDPTYRVRWGTSFPYSDNLLMHGRWLMEVDRRNDLNQAWFGWSTQNFSYDQSRASQGWGMSLTHDVVLGGTKLALTKSGGYIQYATDKLGQEAHVHSVQLGFRINF
jgi:hypothetical protein